MIEPILPNLWRVGGRCWDGAQPSLSAEADANVYLLRAGDRGLLIDCGSVEGRPLIEANVREAGLEPDALTDLLLSHSHFDHTRGAAEWQRRRRLTTHLSSPGAEALAAGDMRLVGHAVQPPGYDFEPFDVDHAAEDGETFGVCDGRVEIACAHLPGHTKDSALFAFDADGRRVGVCGDITFGLDRTGKLGCIGWLCMLWGSDLAASRRGPT
mgnify:CR=1 FL=1